jgi:Ca-activated chloride channel family protein
MMWFRWIDPLTRRSLALSAIILSLTGLVLAGKPVQPRAEVAIATSSPPNETLSSTASPFSAHGLSGRLAVSHGRLLASGTRPMHVELRVRAEPASPEVGLRTPVAMVLVLDTSGSMAGRKIEDARKAALTMLDEMQPNDMVSVVRFATEAELLLPLGRVGDVRADARHRIEGLRAQGSTDIANALRSAGRALEWTRDTRVARIVVVTDGRDTSGAPRSTGADVARAEAARGFTVSALGIGEDYDDAYLAGISGAGRGNYEFLRDSSALARFLSKELDETARTRIRNLEARLSLPNEARIRNVWGATWDGDRLSIGSLFAGDERRVIVAIDVPAGAPGTSANVGGSISWRAVDGLPMSIDVAPIRIVAVTNSDEVDVARDMSVIASATSVMASERETEAARAFERGDRARALALNRESQAELDSVKKAAPAGMAAELDAQKRAYESHQGTFASAPATAAAPAAREIGVMERKNADRPVAY